MQKKLEDLSTIISCISHNKASTLQYIPQVASQASHLLNLVQQQVYLFLNASQKPTSSWCATLFMSCQVLTDIAISGFVPESLTPILQLLTQIQNQLHTRVDDVMPLSNSFQILVARLNAAHSYQKSNKMPFAIFWNPTIRQNLSISDTMPHEADFWSTLLFNSRPLSLPNLSSTTVAFPDYLSRLYSSFKASHYSNVLPDVHHALQNGSLNLYSVLHMSVVSHRNVTPRRGVHGSARWSVDVQLLVERFKRRW